VGAHRPAPPSPILALVKRRLRASWLGCCPPCRAAPMAPHASPPCGAARGPFPTPTASLIKDTPSPLWPLFFPLSSSLASVRSSSPSPPSSLSLALCPRWPTELPPPCRLHTAAPGPAQPPSLSRGVPAGRATPRPPATLPGRATAPPRAWPPHGDRIERTCSIGWARATVPRLGLKCRPNTVRQFSDFQFLFNISEIRINLENVWKIQYYLEKYETHFCILHKNSSTHRN
jgi:hypothetical protein